MKNRKRLGALAMVLAIALSVLAGCGSKNPGAASGSTSGSASGSADQVTPMDLSQVTDPYLAVSGLAADEVVARLGDAEITAGDYLYWLNRVITDYYSQIGTLLPWDVELSEGVAFGQQVVDEAMELAVYHCILRVLAQQEELTPDPSIATDVDKQYVNMILQAEGDESRVIYLFWAQMLTKELLIKLSENSDLSNQLTQLYFGEDSGSYPTDAEVNAFLEEEGYFRVKHILLMTIDQATNEPLDEDTIAQKKADADDLLAQLRDAEDPITLFDQLMNEYSEDGGLAANPDGYIFDATSSLIGGFREAALELSVGEISDVVETDYGYHIMLRLPIDPADYRADCVSALFKQKVDEETQRLGLEKTAAFDKVDVSTFWDNMQSLQSAVQMALSAAY